MRPTFPDMRFFEVFTKFVLRSNNHVVNIESFYEVRTYQLANKINQQLTKFTNDRQQFMDFYRNLNFVKQFFDVNNSFDVKNDYFS